MNLPLGKIEFESGQQLAQAAACRCYHDVRVRLGRCLLMGHDRAESDYLRLFRRILADMLWGRSAVTIGARQLQDKKCSGIAAGRYQFRPIED